MQRRVNRLLFYSFSCLPGDWNVLRYGHSTDPDPLQSIMPLSQLTPALLLAPAQLKKGNSADLSAPKTTWSTQLNSLLRPLMQTPRSVSQKYRTRVAQLLLEEELEGEYTTEDDFMFLAMKYDKDDGAKEGETEAEAEERWRNGVLERMERREYAASAVFLIPL